jgi:uncharacterized protein (DUF1684 family)
LDLADYRRKVQAIYSAVRDKRLPIQQRWDYWVAARDELIGAHVQSPLSAEQRAAFSGLVYYEYDPALRFLVDVEPVEDAEVLEVPLQADGVLGMQRVGRVRFPWMAREHALTVFRLLGYAGGLFLPFRDKSEASYQGTRYLLDTIKGADQGNELGKLVVDFNFAYNPSCAYHPRWLCPLAPAENWLDVAIEGGEQAYPGAVHSVDFAY